VALRRYRTAVEVIEKAGADEVIEQASADVA
jgi:CHAD domain-containing protein